MSAFGGVCQWDGRPIAPEGLSALSSHLHVAGPDRSGRIQPAPWLVLQAHLVHFDRLSSHERQPYSFGEGSVLTWDGRLDNREDLLLSLHRFLGHDRTDAAIVAAAFQRWGVDAMPRLIGDWSLAIWDAPQRRIILGSDYMGVRPLYYRAERDRLAWATSLEALATCENLMQSPDDVFLASHLAGEAPVDMTPFAGVSTLVAGHVLIATRAGATVRRHWRYEPSTLRYQRPDRYADHLRMLLTEAVRVRLRASRTVWAHLSGGWDSSSVVCLAHNLITQGCVEAPNLRTMSIVYSDHEADSERHFMAAVEGWCRIETHAIPYQGPPTFAEMLGQRIPVPSYTGYSMNRVALEAGDHIVLSGSLGDLFKTRIDPPLAFWEAFRIGQFGAYRRSLIASARSKNVPLVTTLLGSLRTRFTRAPRESSPALGVTPELLSQVRSRPRVDVPNVAEFLASSRSLVTALYTAADRGMLRNEERWAPVCTTHPFVHRPLIEFLIAVPRLALFDPQFDRIGMRRALVDVLPAAILERRTKVGIPQTSYKRAAMRAMDSARLLEPFSDAITTWRLVRRGVVLPATLASEVDTIRGSHKPSSFLRRCLMLEAWLRSIESARVEAVRPLEHTPIDVESRQAIGVVP